MLRLAAAGAVGAYQRHISPRKGFCCAYRAHTGRVSCSEFGRRVILKLGLGAFLRLMPRQLARCRAAYAALNRLGAGKPRKKGRPHRALDRCDCSSACDLADCAPDGCDAPCDCSC